jgi:hypothetical protein
MKAEGTVGAPTCFFRNLCVAEYRKREIKMSWNSNGGGRTLERHVLDQ